MGSASSAARELRDEIRRPVTKTPKELPRKRIKANKGPAKPVQKPELRRQPMQARAKLTVDRILQAAEALIAEEGAGEVKMRKIALRAEIPIGSLYMYFPNREAIIRAITDRFHAYIDATLQEMVSAISAPEDLLKVVEQSVDWYYKFIRTTPGVLNLWTGSMYNQMLAQLSVEDSQRTAKILYEALRPHLGRKQAKQALPGLLVCVDMIGSISLVAASLNGKEGAKVVREMKRMILLYAADLMRIDPASA
jgi:AcrR family transcriptional regulator